MTHTELLILLLMIIDYYFFNEVDADTPSRTH